MLSTPEEREAGLVLVLDEGARVRKDISPALGRRVWLGHGAPGWALANWFILCIITIK